jgi:hypothetical protein
VLFALQMRPVFVTALRARVAEPETYSRTMCPLYRLLRQRFALIGLRCNSNSFAKILTSLKTDGNPAVTIAELTAACAKILVEDPEE